MFLQTQKGLKDFHQALLFLKQIFIPEDYGVILVRLVVAPVVIASLDWRFLSLFHMIYIPKICLFIRTLLASRDILLLLLLGLGKRQILMQR